MSDLLPAEMTRPTRKQDESTRLHESQRSQRHSNFSRRQ